jgi:hypothetical protein
MASFKSRHPRGVSKSDVTSLKSGTVYRIYRRQALRIRMFLTTYIILRYFYDMHKFNAYREILSACMSVRIFHSRAFGQILIKFDSRHPYRHIYDHFDFLKDQRHASYICGYCSKNACIIYSYFSPDCTFPILFRMP